MIQKMSVLRPQRAYFQLQAAHWGTWETFWPHETSRQQAAGTVPELGSPEPRPWAPPHEEEMGCGKAQAECAHPLATYYTNVLQRFMVLIVLFLYI